MTTGTTDIGRMLAEPFHARDVEWRIGRCGKKKDGSGIWATCFAYITNRAIMTRLDEVCGVGGWANRFEPIGNGALLCGISIKVGDEWVTKWDGSDPTDIEPVKGTLSSAQKRAGVQWGIGRYLYDLSEGFVEITDDRNDYYGRLPKEDGGETFRWRPPTLPAWALPGGVDNRDADPAPQDDPGEQNPTQQPAKKPAGDAGKDALLAEIRAMEKKLPPEVVKTIRGRLGSTPLDKASAPQLKAVMNAYRDQEIAGGGR